MKNKHKHKHKNKVKQSSKLYINLQNIILLLVFLSLSLMIVYVTMISFQSTKFTTEVQPKQTTPIVNLVQKTNNQTIEKSTIIIDTKPQISIDKSINNTHKKVIVEESLPALEEPTPALDIVYKKKSNKTQKVNTKPKLAIIIDDVSFKHEVNKILNLGFEVTMAFLPPTAQHKNSAKIAKDIPFYMIHFPLEAMSFKYSEKNTLKINDSYNVILNRVKQLHMLFPNATYTNNHTGSKFTSNTKAMQKLMRALKQYNFSFVDSKTTIKSVAKQTASEYNIPFLARNIFLDNKQDKDYIQTQIIRVVHIAKKDGFAIAICHPRRITLKTLKASKHLFKDVQLVLINQL
jgi:polysaccharide deacetylase 2 family uncharacterized protein YibQ/Na+-transporting methylmalonyl-CoA/oxaloacetate decarboxylase gamma subunit